MHTVKRAIIMAAGKGTRMQPLTFEIPKPLISVNGTRMIDTVINGLHENGIYEIYVVAGYKIEQFYELEKTYNGLKVIENPYYETCNNISSLYVARDCIEDAIILDGDQIIYDSAVLSSGFDSSGYNCIWTDEWTEEWVLTVNDGKVTSCSRNGGKNGWQLFSVSRWTAEDGKKLKKHLEIEFDIKRNRQLYWDDVALFCYPDEYRLGIRQMKPGDIIEVDSIEELAEIDQSYKVYLN